MNTAEKQPDVFKRDKIGLGSLSLGSNGHTITHTGRKRAPLHDMILLM